MQDLPRPTKSLLAIGAASKALGVSIDTIRRWDSAGKIRVVRTPGGTRLIPKNEIERLKAGVKITPEKLPEVKEPATPQIPAPIIISKPTVPTPSVEPAVPTPQPPIEQTPIVSIPETLPVETTAAPAVSAEPSKTYQKVLDNIRFYRPVWYQRWHTHPASRPTHLAILGVVLIAAASLFVYQWFIVPAAQEQKERLKELGDVLAAATPPRILSFQGRLTDENGVPETGATNIRFRIWDQLSGGTEGDCSGFDEDCLWRSAVRSVDPDQNGIFSVTLGDAGPGDPAISSTLFSDYADLYLGVTAGADSEMIPRQRIASVSYALNSDSLDGIDSLSFLRSDTSDTFSGGTLTLTFAGTQNLATTSDLAGTVNVVSVIGTPSGSAGTTQGVFIQQANHATNTNGLDVAFAIDNADADLAITDAILITNSGGGGYGDYIDAPNFDVTNAGAVTAVSVNSGAGLLQGSLGLTITGAAVSLNDSSNFGTNINTGTSTGTITIGNSTSTNIKLGKFTTENSLIYTADGAGDGTLAALVNGTTGQCLTATTNLAPSWGSCGGGSFSGEVDDTTNDALTFTTDDASPPAGTVDSIFRDNTGDLNINTISGKTLNLQIAGADEYNLSSTGINLNTNILENIGNANTDFIATTGALTLAGVLTANGGIDMGTNTISGTTAVISFTDFGVTADGLTTIAPDGAGTALTLTLGNVANQAIVINATTPDNEATAGVIDLNVDSATNGNIGFNIDYTGVGAGGTAQTLKGFNLDYTIPDDNDATDTFYATEIDIHRSSSVSGDDTGDTQYGFYIHDNNDADDFNIDALLVVETQESAMQTPDDLIRLVTSGSIVNDGIDASNANIVNAINVGTNTIYATGSFTIDLYNAADDTLTIDNTNAGGVAHLGLSGYLNLGSLSADPGASVGRMYYSTSASKFRCYEGAAWKDCDTGGGGGTALDQITAATSGGSAQDSNANSIFWNWDFTSAGADTGLTISESSASTNGAQDQQALLEITTLVGSSASPLQITNNSNDFGDIWINLVNAGDFEIRDGGTAFATFSDTSTITFNLNNGSTTALQIQDGGTNQLVIDTTNNRNYLGNPTADGTGVLTVFDTKNTSGDPTGVDGAMYYNSATGDLRCYIAGDWKNCDRPTLRQGMFLYEDFMSNTIAAGTGADLGNIGQLNWTYVSTGVGTLAKVDVGADASDQGRLGILRLNSPATAGAGTQLRLDNTGIAGVPGDMVVEWDFGPANAAAATEQQVTIRIGLHDSINASAPTDGIYFQYNVTTTAGNWFRCTMNNTASTCTDTGIAATTTLNQYQRFKIVTNSAGTQVDYYINEASAGSNTTNLPAAARSYGPTINFNTVDAIVRQYKIDYFQLRRTNVTR